MRILKKLHSDKSEWLSNTLVKNSRFSEEYTVTSVISEELRDKTTKSHKFIT